MTIINIPITEEIRKKNIDPVQEEIKNEKICEICHREMILTTIRKKRNKYDKGHSMYNCICGNQLRKRTYREVLRDLGERD